MERNVGTPRVKDNLTAAPQRADGITVAIATMDRPDALARCLDALQAGTVLPAEVVVVDQSGGDATRRMIEQRRQETGEPLVYLRQPRSGLAASRNAGITCASHPVVAVTDDDCVPSPAWVETVEAVFASTEGVQAVTGRVLPLGPAAPGAYATSSRISTERRDFRGRQIPMLVGTGANCAVKREWHRRTGGYDERLGAGSPGQAGEDIDFYYRLLRCGATIRYEPGVLVYHQQHDEARYQASRWTYGYGIGAFCGIWLARRDGYPLRILGFWLRFHGRRLLTELAAGNGSQARLAGRLLLGTASGLLYGLRAALQKESP